MTWKQKRSRQSSSNTQRMQTFPSTSTCHVTCQAFVMFTALRGHASGRRLLEWDKVRVPMPSYNPRNRFHAMKRFPGSDFAGDIFPRLTFGFTVNAMTRHVLCPVPGEPPARFFYLVKKVADQPVRGRERHALLTRLRLQAQTAPAAAVPIAAGERRQVTHHCNTDGGQ